MDLEGKKILVIGGAGLIGSHGIGTFIKELTTLLLRLTNSDLTIDYQPAGQPSSLIGLARPQPQSETSAFAGQLIWKKACAV